MLYVSRFYPSYGGAEVGRTFVGMEQEVRRNRDIDNFLLTGQFEIDEQWGFEQLADYANELMLLRAGAEFKDLGIAARRHSALPGIIDMSGASPKLVSNPEILKSAEMTPSGSFAHLRLQGVMRSQDGASSRGIGSLVNDFHNAFQNDNIAGVLLEANTGGGESLSGTMLQGIMADSPKPVVVWAHFLGSAGVRATLPASEIIASSEAGQIGSIGTFLTLSKDFASYYTAWYEDIYADKSSNKNKEFREYLKGNMQPLRDSVNRSNDFFTDEVQRYRQLKRDVEHTLSGAMFTAKEARSRGLIDGIGNFTYAVSRLQANVRLQKTA